MQSLEELLVHRLTKAYSPFQSEAETRAGVQEIFSGIKKRMTDRSWAQSYFENFPLPNLGLEYYFDRFQEITIDSKTYHWVTGLRFVDLDPQKPFLEIVAYDAFPSSISDRNLALLHLLKTYGSLHPLFVRVFLSPTISIPPNATEGKILMTGRTQDIAHLHSKVPTVSLQTVIDLESAHKTYVAIYERLYAEKPQLKTFAHIESLEDFQNYHRQDLLFEIRDLKTGDWVGIIAGNQHAHQGLVGIEVSEIVLAPERQGHGLGFEIQVAFAQKILSRTPLVYGTIHAQNHTALRTAEKVGRRPLGHYVEWSFANE